LYQFLTKYIKDIGILTKILIVLYVLLLLSCTSSPDKRGAIEERPFRDVLEEFKEVFPILRQYSWEVYSGHENDDKTEIELELDGISGDTTMVVALWKTTTISSNNLHTNYSITRFIKKYTDDQYVYNIHTIGGQKILYHYYHKIDYNDPRGRIFIEGKYRYLYNLGIFDDLQTKYYLQHQDSLDNIKGDSILELPRIK